MQYDPETGKGWAVFSLKVPEDMMKNIDFCRKKTRMTKTSYILTAINEKLASDNREERKKRRQAEAVTSETRILHSEATG